MTGNNVKQKVSVKQGFVCLVSFYASRHMKLEPCYTKTTNPTSDIFFLLPPFLQGQTFECPERVPFRLTRNMECAMGPMGKEGIFRRACEVTMKVMRDQREPLMRYSQSVPPPPPLPPKKK